LRQHLFDPERDRPVARGGRAHYDPTIKGEALVEREQRKLAAILAADVVG
jgi:hypothetical protein